MKALTVQLEEGEALGTEVWGRLPLLDCPILLYSFKIHEAKLKKIWKKKRTIHKHGCQPLSPLLVIKGTN